MNSFGPIPSRRESSNSKYRGRDSMLCYSLAFDPIYEKVLKTTIKTPTLDSGKGVRAKGDISLNTARNEQ